MKCGLCGRRDPEPKIVIVGVDEHGWAEHEKAAMRCRNPRCANHVWHTDTAWLVPV